MSRKFIKSILMFNRQIFDTVTSLAAIFYLSRPVRLFSKQASVSYSAHKAANCLVLGNGPSVNLIKEEISYVKKHYDVLAMNYFALTPLFDKLCPRFYVLQDTGIFYGNKIDDYYQNKNDELIRKFESLDFQINIFIPVSARKSNFVKKLKLTKANICFFNPTSVTGFAWFRSQCFNLRLGMPRPETVAHSSIFIAMGIGYSHLHLLGCEQSWLKDLAIDDDNVVHVHLNHFYKGKSAIARGSSLDTLATFLESQAKCFRSHEMLALYAKEINCEIINFTPKSYIDAYPKKDFWSHFK